MKTHIFVSLILCMCVLFALSAFAVPEAVGVKIVEFTEENMLYEETNNVLVYLNAENQILPENIILQKNNTVEITKSPTDTFDYVYYLETTTEPGKQSWTYLRLDTTGEMKAGTVYKVSFDVFCKDDAAGNVPEDVSFGICFNFAENDSNSSDHGIGTVSVIPGQWYHVDAMYQVPETMEEEKNSAFGIFASPQEKNAINYYLDDVCVYETELQNGIDYSFEDGTLRINGDDVTNYNGVVPWEKYKDQITTVVIKDGIKQIGWKAFSDCEKLTNVIIPDSVNVIDSFAFRDCINLKEIELPDSLSSIGNSAFSGCESLEKVVIPNGVKTISGSAFNDCINLKEIELPDSLGSIGNSAFSGCESLEKVVIPNGVKTISDSAFNDCINLKEIELPDSLSSIGNSAFSVCKSLEKILIPNGVETIGEKAFYNCKKLTEIFIPKSVLSIGNEVFGSCDSVMNITVDENNEYYSSDERGVLFNKNKTTLIQYPIGNTSANYEIPQSVTFISNNAFCHSINLERITMYAGIIGIGEEAFADCINIKKISIPKSVENIGKLAFQGCFDLTEIVVDENNEYYLSDENGILFNKDKTILIKYPQKNDLLSYTIPNSVVTIENYAFEFCDFEKVEFGKNVEIIADYAFFSCESLTRAIIPDGVTKIGRSAFYGCDSLTRIEIPQSVTEIGNSAFRNCDNLTIYGYSGSTAEEYANENDIPFVSLGGEGNEGGEIVPEVPGELNSDGVIDVNDAILLLQYSLFPELYPLEYAGDVDFTGDGVVDMNDAILLLQHSMFPELYPIA